MSRGLGALQREIKRVLDIVFEHEQKAMRFADPLRLRRDAWW